MGRHYVFFFFYVKSVLLNRLEYHCIISLSGSLWFFFFLLVLKGSVKLV